MPEDIPGRDQEVPDEVAKCDEKTIGGVTAIQWTGGNLEDMQEFLGKHYQKHMESVLEEGYGSVWFYEELKGSLGVALVTWWILRSEDQEGLHFQSMKPSEFARWANALA